MGTLGLAHLSAGPVPPSSARHLAATLTAEPRQHKTLPRLDFAAYRPGEALPEFLFTAPPLQSPPIVLHVPNVNIVDPLSQSPLIALHVPNLTIVDLT